MTDLSIIIVNFNTAKLTLDAIDSIVKFSHDIKYEIIVIDNSNKQSEIDLAKRYFSHKFPFKHTANHGFGHANNSGAKISRGKYLLFLNPDTIIIDNSLKRMLDFVKKDPKIGAVSPLVYQTDQKSLQHHFYGPFQSFNSIFTGKLSQKQTDLSKVFIESEMVSAACLLTRKEIFEQINGFDEHFFMYLEDDDLCRRISALGYINGVFTLSKIIHLEGKSSNPHQKKKMYYISQDYYWKKHYRIFRTTIMKTIRWPYKSIQLRSF